MHHLAWMSLALIHHFLSHPFLDRPFHQNLVDSFNLSATHGAWMLTRVEEAPQNFFSWPGQVALNLAASTSIIRDEVFQQRQQRPAKLSQPRTIKSQRINPDFRSQP